MDELQELYLLVKKQLRRELSETIFEVWFKGMELISFENGIVTLLLSKFQRDVAEQKFMPHMHRAFEAALGFDVEINIKEPETVNFDTEASASEEVFSGTLLPASVSRLPQGHEANTFETYVVGGSNKFAHAAALAVSANPGKSYNPLFLYGNSGLGKTHLLSAIHHEMKRKFPNINIIYTTGEEFTNEVVRYIQFKSMVELHQKYRTADVLLMDDVQFIAGREATQEEFFHTFNALTQSGRQIVLSSDKPPKDMTTLEDRLRSRFDAGLIADIQPPDLETRMAIVKRKAADNQFDLTDEFVDFIARRLKSNIRQLEGAVNRIEALVVMRGMPLNMKTMELAISDIESQERPASVVIERIIEETARCYQVSATDIRSKRRSASISRARQISMYIISEMTGFATKAVGLEFSRDHSTVVYALREIRAALPNDPGLRKNIGEITKLVQEF